MSQYRVACIGTGPEPDNPVWGESAAMAYRHGDGYRQHDQCELVACADIVQENALAFAEEFDIPEGNVFEDYGELLAEADPDVVSVCTPVPTHAPIVTDVVRSGVPDAVHCEKPMADTWKASRTMAQEADRHDVKLTFNHQRRVGEPARQVRELVADGEIGDPVRVEVATKNIYDAGTHFIDMAGSFVGEPTADWVIGQLDYREENVRYGVHNENQALAHWEYENGVTGTAYTGFENAPIDGNVRVTGTEGVVELGPPGDAHYRVRRDGEGWESVETDGPISSIPRALATVVTWLDGGAPSGLRARNALNTTEIIFGAYESVRQRGRVDLPLDADDNPLVGLVESGEIVPEAADEDSD